MTLGINMNAGAAVNGPYGLITSAGNPWIVPDAFAQEVVNRGLATPINWPASAAMLPIAAAVASANNPTNHKRFVFVGDSLTQGNNQRATGVFDGRCWWPTTPVLTNLGAGNWVVLALIDGRAPAPAGTLQTDGFGRLQFQLTGDSGYGPYVDVSAGGWFLLNSATSPYQCWVAVRGGTAPPASAGTGALTTGGVPYIQDSNPLGFAWWVAGALGDTFTDYQLYGITGAKSTDGIKWLPQICSRPIEAACVLMGVNEGPNNGAEAVTLIGNIKAIVTGLLTVSNRVYLGEIFPYTGASATLQKYYQLVSNALRVWAKTTPRVRFWSATQYVMSPTAVATQMPGVFFDTLHLMPYGGYRASIDLVRCIQQDYPNLDGPRVSYSESYDAVVGVGCWNANPTLRGTAGSGSGAAGWSGTVPDSWNGIRSGTTQTCVGSFVVDPSGGLSWYTMSVAGAAASDYSELYQTVNVPAGINAGDYFSIYVEMRIGAMSGGGLTTFALQANGNGNGQASYMFQLSASRQVDTFSTELPVVRLQSEAQLLLAGTTSFTLRIRLGAATATGTGIIGIRNLKIEKVSGPAGLIA